MTAWPPPPPPPEPVDPVERWLALYRCCGAPQLCGARCMDDEDSQTGARVARELDDARGRIVDLESRLTAIRDLWVERCGYAHDDLRRRIPADDLTPYLLEPTP